MKKLIWLTLAVLISATAFAANVKDKMTFEGPVTFKGTVTSSGVSSFSASTIVLRGITYTLPSNNGDASQYLQTNGSGTLSWATGTSGSLDDGYNAGAVIAVDDAAVQFRGTHATNNAVFVNMSTGSGHGIQITNAGTGKDINGTGNTWHVTKAGLGTFVGVTSTGTITVTGAKIAGASPLVFEGNTADGTNVNTFAITDPTAARTTTFPDATGTVKLNGTATHDYSSAHADWTLSVAEKAVGYITATNADAGANVLLSAAIPGQCYFINNQSGQILTFKVTGQTGGTIASGKRAYYCSDAVDLYEIWEQS